MAHVHGQEGLRYSERYESLGKLKEGQQPGVYGWDPLNLGKHLTEDEKAARNAQELNNGRLAMVAALGVLAEEARTGVPVAQKLGLVHWSTMDFGNTALILNVFNVLLIRYF